MFPVAGVLLGNLLSHQHSRMETYQKIQKSEENLRQVVQNMPVMLDAFDENDNIIVWNKECERVTGFTAEEVINNPDALTLFYPDPKQRQILQEDLKNANQKFMSREWKMTTKDGTQKTIFLGQLFQ